VLGAAAALLLCAAAAQAFRTTAVATLEAVRQSGPDAPADLLLLGTATLGLLLVLWLALGLLLSVVATLPGAAGRLASAVADRVTPPLVRRAAAVLLGTTIAATGTPLAHAAETAPRPATSKATVSVSVAPAPDPGFAVTARIPVAAPAVQRDLPRAPTPPPAPDPAFRPRGLGPLGPAPRSTSVPQRTVTVTSGDSLWAIAARHLGPRATAQQIAREWPRWYAANRDVIGGNPDVIHVGQVLTVPGETS
jgi:hypothetical protein